MKKILILMVVIIELGIGFFTQILSQSSHYKIQKEDRLKISFWENPELNTDVVVDKDGGIELPIVGRMKVEGLKIEELKDQIISQMSLFNKLINHVTITVEDFGRNRVFVTGEVVHSGRYSFEEIPGVWDIILEAGGPLQTARLDKVNIIRNGNEGKIVQVDINRALQIGKIDELPQIYPGDTIHLPGADSPFESIESSVRKKNEIYVFGAIGIPGPHPFEENLNLLDAIGMAGGPTADANLEHIKYVSVYKQGTQVLEFNLKLYLDYSLKTPIPLVTPGSTIYIPPKRKLSRFMTAVVTTAVSAAITSIIIVSIR